MRRIYAYSDKYNNYLSNVPISFRKILGKIFKSQDTEKKINQLPEKSQLKELL